MDDDLPEEVKKQFLERHSGLPLLGSSTLARCYLTNSFDRIEHHMLCDGSQDVFCIVSFLRAQLTSSYHTEFAFVFGKALVAPMKALSIQKIEHQAALLASV